MSRSGAATLPNSKSNWTISGSPRPRSKGRNSTIRWSPTGLEFMYELYRDNLKEMSSFARSLGFRGVITANGPDCELHYSQRAGGKRRSGRGLRRNRLLEPERVRISAFALLAGPDGLCRSSGEAGHLARIRANLDFRKRLVGQSDCRKRSEGDGGKPICSISHSDMGVSSPATGSTRKDSFEKRNGTI